MMKKMMGAAVLVSGMILGIGGCASEKEFAAAGMSNSVQSFQQQLSGMPKRIDDTMSTLRELYAGNNTDRAATLSKFSNQLSALSSDARALGDAELNGQKNVENYMAAWIKESRRIDDPAQRESAVAAMKQSKAKQNIAMGYIETGSKNYRELMDTLKSIQGDLTKNPNAYTSEALARKYDTAVRSSEKAKNSAMRLDELIVDTFAKG